MIERLFSMNDKRILAFLLAFLLILCTGCSAGTNDGQSIPEEEPREEQEQLTGTGLGDRIADFTVTTYDGKTFTLSEILAEKKLVLINIWATWCGPCKMEFPIMDEVYRRYSDRVEILAISGDPSDTDQKIGEVAAELGLTFPMGRDSAGLAERFAVAAFPTTIVVDRFGTICLVETGAQTEADSFRNLFDAFTGEDYTESVVLKGFPTMKPTAERLSEKELSAALNVEGGTLTFRNSANIFVWPMAAAEKDGRTVLTATNGGRENTASSVELTVNAKAGEVLAFEFAVSSEKGFDCMRLTVDGTLVKRFSGERGWMRYAYAFLTDGEHKVVFSYEKDNTGNGGADTVWLDNVALLSGKTAEEALAANPVYPVGQNNSIRVTNENVRKITVEDPNGVLRNFFGGTYEAYIVNDDAADFTVTLAEGVDPHAAMVYDNHFVVQIMADVAGKDGYVFSCAVDTPDTTGTAASYAVLVPDPAGQTMYPVIFFSDEENATSFLAYNVGGSWEYDNSENLSSNLTGDVSYTLKFVDQKGQRVEGVVAKVCNAEACVMAVSDENGLCELTLPAYAYEVQILKLPEGYDVTTETPYTAPAAGGELVITLKKN